MFPLCDGFRFFLSMALSMAILHNHLSVGTPLDSFETIICQFRGSAGATGGKDHINICFSDAGHACNRGCDRGDQKYWIGHPLWEIHRWEWNEKILMSKKE